MAEAPKVKLSDLRAQYPMYGSLSDEQLIMGLAKAKYPGVPLQKLAERIDFDTGPSPVEGMSTGERFMAGAGKAFTDIGRGVGQALGIVSRDDVKQSRREDEALMNTGAGFAGNVAGNVAALVPTALIPGAATLRGAAAIGGATGLLAPSESTEETIANVAMGGAAAPAGLMAGRALAGGYQAARGIVAPFTQSGREGIAARSLQRFAGGPQEAAAAAQRLRGAQPLVPGTVPTTAEVAENAGLAQLDRSIRNLPDVATRFGNRDMANRAARQAAVQSVAGDDVARSAAEATRRANANQLYEQAFADGIDPAVMTPEVTRRIDTLMARPSIQRARDVAMRLAAEEGEEVTDAGSVKGLHYLKRGLDSMIDSGKATGISADETRLMQGTRDRLLDLIDDLSPTYGQARRQYAQDSLPINRMDIGNRLAEALTPATGDFGQGTRETFQKYASALRNADATAAAATGRKGARMADVLSPDQLQLVTAVARDLGRKANAQEMGRSVGSNTLQNMASQDLLQSIAGPLGLRGDGGGPVNMLAQSIIGRPFDFATKVATPQLQEMLAEAMLDPARAAQLLRYAEQRGLIDRGAAAAARFLPGASAAGPLSTTSSDRGK